MMPQVQDSDYLSTHIYSRLILPIALPLQLPGRNRHHRSGRASAFAMPFFLSHSMAFSMSQSHSARAFLASRIPAPADVGTNGYKWHKPSLNAKAEIPHTFCKESAKNPIWGSSAKNLLTRFRLHFLANFPWHFNKCNKWSLLPERPRSSFTWAAVTWTFDTSWHHTCFLTGFK